LNKENKIKQGNECSEDIKESSIEERERVDKVQELFRDVRYKTEEDKEWAILSLVKSASLYASLVHPLQ
jgi:hypothetical protein